MGTEHLHLGRRPRSEPPNAACLDARHDAIDVAPEIRERLASWAAAQGHDLGLEHMWKFPGGIANLNYLVQLDGRPAVLRRPPSGKLAAGAGDVAREWRVLSRLSAVFPLAPKVLLFCPHAEVMGVPFLVLEFRDGLSIGGEIPKGMPSDAPARLTDAMTGSLASLHSVPPASLGLDNVGSPTGFLERQLERWLGRAQAVWPGGLPPAARSLYASLRKSVPEQAETRLLHMDFKLDNLLVDAESLAPTALIDWEMATRGCPLFDIAVLLSYWVEPGDPPELHSLGQVPSLTTGFGTRRDLADRYFAARGIEPAPVAWHVGCARLRLATAWMQLFVLWQRGALLGDRYASFPSIAAAVLDFAAERVREDKV